MAPEPQLWCSRVETTPVERSLRLVITYDPCPQLVVLIAHTRVQALTHLKTSARMARLRVYGITLYG